MAVTKVPAITQAFAGDINVEDGDFSCTVERIAFHSDRAAFQLSIADLSCKYHVEGQAIRSATGQWTSTIRCVDEAKRPIAARLRLNDLSPLSSGKGLRLGGVWCEDGEEWHLDGLLPKFKPASPIRKLPDTILRLPSGTVVTVYGRQGRVAERLSGKIDLTDDLMRTQSSRRVTIGVANPRWGKWTQPILATLEKYFEYDLGFDGYRVKSSRLDMLLGQDTSRPATFRLVVRSRF